MHLVNMTATLRFDGRIDLQVILTEHPFVASRNRGFDAISVMMLRSSVTALLYSSGSVVLVGGDSDECLAAATSELCELVNLPLVQKVKIHNMVFSTSLGRQDLIKVHGLLRSSLEFANTSFEPELFPALVCQEKGTSRKGCLFRSGKLNVTGCKSLEEASSFVTLIRHTIT